MFFICHRYPHIFLPKNRHDMFHRRVNKGSHLQIQELGDTSVRTLNFWSFHLHSFETPDGLACRGIVQPACPFAQLPQPESRVSASVPQRKVSTPVSVPVAKGLPFLPLHLFDRGYDLFPVQLPAKLLALRGLPRNVHSFFHLFSKGLAPQHRPPLYPRPQIFRLSLLQPLLSQFPINPPDCSLPASAPPA